MSKMVERNTGLIERKIIDHTSEKLQGDPSHDSLEVGSKEWWLNEIGNVFASLDLQIQMNIEPSTDQIDKWRRLSEKYHKVLIDFDISEKRTGQATDSDTFGEKLQKFDSFFQ